MTAAPVPARRFGPPSDALKRQTAPELDDDEWRAAIDDLDEAERAQNCGHTIRGRNGVCVHCQEGPDL